MGSWVQPMEIYVDDEAKLTLHGLVQHYVRKPQAISPNPTCSTKTMPRATNLACFTKTGLMRMSFA